MSARQKVQVWVFSVAPSGDRHFLLLQTTPARGSFWQPVTGSVDSGESLEAAAIREVREETGLLGELMPLGRRFTYERNRVSFLEEGYAFCAKGEETPRVTIDPREHVAYDWVSSDEAERRVHHESNREMLRTLIQLLNHPRKESHVT